MARNVDMSLIWCSIVAMVFIIGVSEATEYTVGDSFGWNVPTKESFYTDWASNKKFFVGDRLNFNLTGEHTVGIEREDTNYKNCNTSAIGSPFGGTQTVFGFGLTETGPHYFLCTVGNHCSRGQKFSINVSSTSQTASAPSSTLSSGILSTFLSTLAVYLLARTS